MVNTKDTSKIVCLLLLFFCLACKDTHHAGNNQYDRLMLSMLGGYPLPEKAFVISDEGKGDVLNYEDYGEFVNLGQKNYRYKIKDRQGLRRDIGIGIYPSHTKVKKEPNYKIFVDQGLLKESHWKLLKSNNKELAFYSWATVHDDPGVKAFFTAKVLEDSGYILHAIKAYYASVVHFPGSAGWAEDQSFVWYIAPVAMGQIKRLCRDYPELNLDYVDAMFDIQNGQDTKLDNDIITVHPGRFIKKTIEEKLEGLPRLSEMEIIERRGSGKVQLVKFSNGHWQLQVDQKPFIVRGLTYGPTEIGIGPQNDPNFDMRWMFSDKNGNGIIDAPYEAWNDKNGNGKRDENEPVVGDFQLMKEMGVNTIRLFIPNITSTQYDPASLNKPLLRELYAKYGIRIIAGDFLGAYTVGSGADWKLGTDYQDPKQRALMKAAVRQKVLDLKDEPFLLMWLLGNENNMSADYTGVNATRTQAAQHPQAYAEFLNEVAKMIHELDPDHPVAIGNVGMGMVEYYDQYAPAIDVLGVNGYPGQGGFGTLWDEAKRKFDRPVLITEYGADVYDKDLQGPNEQAQRDYYFGNHRDIVLNQAGGIYAGNAIGGVVFEYLDEWWKDTHGHPVTEQQSKYQYPAAFFDGYTHEEWFGIAGQGSGQNSPFERRLRAAYFMFKDLWTEQD